MRRKQALYVRYFRANMHENMRKVPKYALEKTKYALLHVHFEQIITHFFTREGKNIDIKLLSFLSDFLYLIRKSVNFLLIRNFF